MAILSIGELLGMGPSELSGLMPYSGLEYSGSVITGISGSAIGGQGGGTDPSTISAIASAYAESAASSKVDTTAFNDCCSAVNDALSGISAAVSGVTGKTGNYIDWSASGDFQPAGDYQPSGDYAYNSSLTAYQPTGDYAFNSALTAYQPSGDYAFNSSLSGKLDNSASSTWYPMTGNPSGFLTEHQSLSGYATEEYVDSSVSGKQDASGMSAYATTGDLSDKLDASAVNFDGDSSHVTGISGVPLSAQGGGVSFPMDIYVQNSASGILTTGVGARTNSHEYYGASQPALIISACADPFWPGENGYQGYPSFMAVSDSASGIGPGNPEYPFCSAAYGSNGLRMTTGTAYWYEGSELQVDGNGIAYSNRVSGTSVDSWRFGLNEFNLLSSLSAATGGDYVEKSAMEVAIGNGNNVNSTAFAQGSANSSVGRSFTQGDRNNAEYFSFAQGSRNLVRYTSFAHGSANNVVYTSFTDGIKNSASYGSFAQGSANSAYEGSFAQGFYNTASRTSFAQGRYNSAINTAAVFGQFNLRGDGDISTGNSAAFAIGDGTSTADRHDLLLVTKDGEIRTYSSTADTTGLPIIATLRAISAWATANGWTGM